jgi:hypothetical protein
MTFEIPLTVDVPDGNYTATLESVQEDTGNFGKYRKWTWLVEATIDGTLQIVPLTQLTSANTGPQSKSYRQLTALLGEAPKAGQKIESPTGKRAIVTVTHNEKGFPKIDEIGPFVEPQQTLPGIPR